MSREKEKTCICGAEDCWDRNDYSWLSSRSGWHGDVNGCPSSVFFIHGKKIREQRHIPYGEYPVASFPALLEHWAAGLPNARFFWCEDTGDGDSGLWIEGEREPNAADQDRLEQARTRERANAVRDYRSITEKFPDLLKHSGEES